LKVENEKSHMRVIASEAKRVIASGAKRVIASEAKQSRQTIRKGRWIASRLASYLATPRRSQ
jgi:hypothetical protein